MVICAVALSEVLHLLSQTCNPVTVPWLRLVAAVHDNPGVQAFHRLPLRTERRDCRYFLSDCGRLALTSRYALCAILFQGMRGHSYDQR